MVATTLDHSVGVGAALPLTEVTNGCFRDRLASVLMAALGRYLPFAISMDESLLVDVAYSKAAHSGLGQRLPDGRS